jgi:hypothetical protein
VSGRTVQRTRSNQWRSSVTTCTALPYSTDTKDPSASTATAPLPTLVVRLGGGVGARFVLAQAAPPAPRSLDQPRRPEPEPEPLPLHLTLEETDRSELLLQTKAEAEPEEWQAPPSNRIEMIIDSLPHHQLIEPIPITIDPLGDSVFTASMRNVDIAATGNSVGEALLLLKEHIDATFEELNRQLAHLTYDQKKTLQMLHTYIAAQAPQGKKSRWL